MASLITSVPPPTHAVDVAALSIRESFTTLAEVLQANGYYTGAIIAHPVLSSGNGYAQGYHYFDVIDNDLPGNFLAPKMTQFALVLGFRWRPSIPERSVIPAISFSDSRIFYFKTRLYATAEEITDAALEFVEEMPETPFFLHLHYFDPHGPYLEHPLARLPDFSFETQESMPRSWELYQDEVTYLDQHIGRFLDQFERTGLSENTYIILTADHGEAFLEHDLFFHGNNLHVEEVKVPLMISGPGIAAGRNVETLSTLTDLGPTITDFAGIPGPESFMGTSLEPLLRGTDEEERMVFSSVRFNPSRQAKHLPQERRREAIRRIREEFGEDPREVGGYFLAVRTNDRSFHCLTETDEGVSVRMLSLYDIDTDPNEMSDLSAVEVEKAEFLKESLLEWYRQNRVVPEEATSTEEQEKLRALGYIF
jgi:arylsulfatase A-like enzyme